MNDILIKKKAVVFDFDGVLIDSVGIKTWAFGEIYSKYGNDVKEKVLEYQKANGGVNRYKKFTFFHKNFLNTNLTESELILLSEQFSLKVVAKLKELPLMNGARNILDKLKNYKIQLFCISATPHAELYEIMDSKNLIKFFSGIYGAPSTKEENLDNLHCKFNIDYSNIVYIGDSEIDFTSSKNKNVDFIGYGSVTPDWGNNLPWIENWSEVSWDY